MESNLRQHNQRYHSKSIEQNKCEHCEKEFITQGNLKQHLFFVHKIGEPKHKCEQCDFATLFQRDMKVHIDKAHLMKKFECEYCGKIHEYFGDDYHEQDRDLWQMDHRIPRHLKTPNNGMPENMALCCTSCNQVKGEYELDKLLPIMKRILKHQEKNNG